MNTHPQDDDGAADGSERHPERLRHDWIRSDINYRHAPGGSAGSPPAFGGRPGPAPADPARRRRIRMWFVIVLLVGLVVLGVVVGSVSGVLS